MIKYYESLITGKHELLLDQLDEDVILFTHLHGKAKEFNNVKNLLAKEKNFTDLNVLNAESIMNVIEDGKEVYEYELNLTNNLNLPSCVFADIKNDKYTSIRIYHSTYPINKTHKNRERFYEKVIKLNGPDSIINYFDALENGDADSVMNSYSDTYSYFREPSGNEFLHDGDKLNEHYRNILKDGGIKLIFHNQLYSKQANIFAVEYTCTGWGNKTLIPQAGMSVYELDPANDKIRSARIYDDVDLSLTKE